MLTIRFKLKHFRKNNEGSIVSYANKRWSNGNLYRKLGFEELPNPAINYFYIVKGELKSRVAYQKHKLKDKLETFDPLKTEYENMLDNGYDRIWDCGNYKFFML